MGKMLLKILPTLKLSNLLLKSFPLSEETMITDWLIKKAMPSLANKSLPDKPNPRDGIPRPE